MNIVAVVLVLLGLYLAFKAVGLMMRMLFWAVVIAGLYWLAAPFLGLPMPF